MSANEIAALTAEALTDYIQASITKLQTSPTKID